MLSGFLFFIHIPVYYSYLIVSVCVCLEENRSYSGRELAGVIHQSRVEGLTPYLWLIGFADLWW